MTEENRSWYNTGYEGIKKEQERIDQMSGPNRMWMPANAKKELVFLDDSPFACHEHNPRIDGDWRNYFTCLKGVYDDAACCEILNRSGYNPYYVGFFTVIDCTEWVDKKGNKYQYEVKLFPAKLKTLKRLENKKLNLGPFEGALFAVTRLDSKSPSCGDEFDLVRKVDMEKLYTLANYKGKKISELFSKGTDAENVERLKNVWQVAVGPDGKVLPKLVPFNYFKLLHPMPPKEIRQILGASHIEAREEDVSGGTTTGGAKADEAAPF